MNSLLLLLILSLSFFIKIFAIAPNESNETFDYLILVNKEYKLPDDYESKVNLVNTTINITNLTKTFEIENKTLEQFNLLRNKLLEKNNSFSIELDSVYRSVKRQQEIWDYYAETKGEDYARKYVAVPGYSEHHTGLAVDVCLVVNGTIIDDNDEMIKQREIFAQVHELLPEFGFILRYLEGKDKITGYSYEPWHLRYIDNISIAENITERGITLEEYLGKLPKNKENILNNNFILLLVIIICLLF